MFTKHDWIVFFAGVFVLHTISHIWLGFSGLLPLTMWGFEITQYYNMFITGISALISVWLLYWSSTTPR